MDRRILGMAVVLATSCSIDDELRIDRDAALPGDGGGVASDGGGVPDAAPDAEVPPQGSISVQYLSAEPEGELAAGTAYVLTLELYNQLTGSAQDEEVFDIAAEVDCETWGASEVDADVVVERDGMATFDVELTPDEGDDTCELAVVATARRNPDVESAPRLDLELGEAPAVGRTLALLHPIDERGRLLVRESELPLEGEPIQFTLANRTDEQADYELELFVTLPDGERAAGWPDETDPQTRSICCIEPGLGQGHIRLFGPAEAAGQEGTLTLRLDDPAEEITRPFIVVGR